MNPKHNLYSKILVSVFFSICMFNSINILTHFSFFIGETDNNQGTEPNPAVNININAWIIVAGDRESDHSLYYCIENGCEEVYDILEDLGYAADRIYYLAEDWDGSLPARASATSEKTNIQYAIETWAADKVSSSLGLGIFLFDHGGTNSMSLPGANLYDTDLNTYLNNLESATGMTRSVIVYEACHSGSFIDPVSKDNRIVVCATDSAHSSYPTADLTSAVFTEAFWSSISVGYSIGEAFENARANVNAAGLFEYQKPWIDDNHDEIGHEVNILGHLPNGGDGVDALNSHIRPPLLIKQWVVMQFIPLPQYITPIDRILPISISVLNNDTDLKYIRAVITPPHWEPPIPRSSPCDPNDPEIIYFPEQEYASSFYIVPFVFNGTAGGVPTFTASVNVQALIKSFGENEGDFGITYMAKTESGVVAQMVPSVLTMNEGGEAPADITPPTLEILNPTSDETLSGELKIRVQGNDDQALEKITILIDGEEVNETNMPSY